MSILRKIQQKVIDRDYYLSGHAEDEMWADELDREDVENAILNGKIDKKLTKDIRGTRYRLEGAALDGRIIHVVCRLNEKVELIIVTLYALEGES